MVNILKMPPDLFKTLKLKNMKTEIKSNIINKRTYPYLAIFIGDPTRVPSAKELSMIKPKDISLINNGTVYVQRLLGDEKGFVLMNEDHYFPLPKGTEVTLTQ